MILHNLPINRGFDSSSGFLGGGGDQMTQKWGGLLTFGKTGHQIPEMDRMMHTLTIVT